MRHAQHDAELLTQVVEKQKQSDRIGSARNCHTHARACGEEVPLDDGGNELAVQRRGHGLPAECSKKRSGETPRKEN